MATPNNRPISPHLQVYKLPLTGIISISHRMTGVMLTFGLLLFTYVASTLAGGEAEYLAMQSVLGVWLIKLVYWGFVYALFFHLCHGVRHLIWDTGQSFSLETLDRYARIELASSLALTLIAFIFI
ncbi:MAG: succinate dehydrogenase, cytochrome b556 subunit [Methylovulum sp.]|nr:succinate dehydrogenase, cytochrome b556 subunit [Methylovulum sp.]